MDTTTQISSRAGSARLTAVLRQFMIFDEYAITDNPDGGFKAIKSFRKAQEGSAFFGLSELRVTPMGREVVVEADLGGIRVIRNQVIVGLTIIPVVLFIVASVDPETRRNTGAIYLCGHVGPVYPAHVCDDRIFQKKVAQDAGAVAEGGRGDFGDTGGQTVRNKWDVNRAQVIPDPHQP